MNNTHGCVCACARRETAVQECTAAGRVEPVAGGRGWGQVGAWASGELSQAVGTGSRVEERGCWVSKEVLPPMRQQGTAWEQEA